MLWGRRIQQVDISSPIKFLAYQPHYKLSSAVGTVDLIEYSQCPFNGKVAALYDAQQSERNPFFVRLCTEKCLHANPRRLRTPVTRIVNDARDGFL